VARVLREEGVGGEWFELEITERMLMEDLDAVAATLAELKALGVRIAIDDFGTGHSSLTRLIRVPATDLKLSPKIVDDMLGSPQAHAIVAAAAEAARNLDLRVIAAGVRTPEHLLAARDAGAHAAQGHAIAAPQAASTAYTILLDRTRNAAPEPAGRVIRLHPHPDLDDPA